MRMANSVDTDQIVPAGAVYQTAPVGAIRAGSTMFAYAILSFAMLGVIGCREGVVYLASSECPTEIGLQLGKAC